MTDLTPERLQELRRIAEEATPGPWGTTRYNGGLRFDGPLRVYAGTDPEYGEPRPIPASAADNRYIAAFDPPTVLAMLDEIERLRAEVEEWKRVAATQAELWGEAEARARGGDGGEGGGEMVVAYGAPEPTPSMFPLGAFDAISLEDANRLLVAWGHKMGPLRRGNQRAWCHALFHNGRPVAVTTASYLIRERVGGGLWHLTRENTVELSRLCAERPGLCRVAIRLWREFVFPTLGFEAAISYQDADLHKGHTYRFDGWARSPLMARSGVDQRSGRIGRRKWVWVWPPHMVNLPESATVGVVEEVKDDCLLQRDRPVCG